MIKVIKHKDVNITINKDNVGFIDVLIKSLKIIKESVLQERKLQIKLILTTKKKNEKEEK